MFKKSDFTIFNLNTLEGRMKEIRHIIQPTFKELGESFTVYLSRNLNNEVPYHIAQHKRRTVNPPESTWLGIGGNNRGYKKFPHFQIGINESHIFIWLALIDNPVNEMAMLECIENQTNSIMQLSDDYILSGDHTRATVKPANLENLTILLSRAKKIKKAELLIGRIIPNDSYLLTNPLDQKDYIEKTIENLLPLYKDLLKVQKNKE